MPGKKGRKCGNRKELGKDYLAKRTRIQNATQKLEKRICTCKEVTQNQVRKHCPIGRKREKKNEVK